MKEEPEDAVKSYLREIGRKGGQKSRRALDPAQARRMVALREARKAFREHHHEYFWSAPADMVVQEAHVPYVIQGLKTEGDRAAYEKARKLQKLWGESECH